MQSSDQASAAEGQRYISIARTAIATASEFVRSKSAPVLSSKGDRDITSDVDRTVEATIRHYLAKQTPSAHFLGEESGGSTLSNDGYHWVLDPIDGTVNLLHGLPLCAISLCLLHNGLPVIAVIDLPFFRVQYHAIAGHGSYVNGSRLHVSTTQQLQDALVSIDQYTLGDDAADTNQLRHRVVAELTPRAQRVRIFGTSAIELAWMAQGRLDACVMFGNKPWDTSAGALIAKEAGAYVVDTDGSDHSIYSAATVAVTPSLQTELLEIIRIAMTI